MKAPFTVAGSSLLLYSSLFRISDNCDSAGKLNDLINARETDMGWQYTKGVDEGEEGVLEV